MTALFSLAMASMAFVQHQPSLKMHIPSTRTGAPCCLLPPLVAALAADVAAGGLAAVGCAPLVACTDQAITLNANGGAKLWPTLIDKMKGVVRKPVAFFSSAAFVYPETKASHSRSACVVTSRLWEETERGYGAGVLFFWLAD